MVSNNNKQDPVFILSDSRIFLNLHKAAVEHCSKLVKMSSNSATINQFIINTICSDGKVILDNSAMESRPDDESFGGNNALHQMGIVLELANLQNLRDKSLTEDDTKLERAKEENRQLLKNAKTKICDAINDYFTWFAGKDSKEFTEDDLRLYIPQYNGGKIRVKSGGNSFELEEMEDQDKFFSMYDPDNTDNPSNAEVEKLIKLGIKLGIADKNSIRIGYKVGYQVK